jgi:hypothetical protein
MEDGVYRLLPIPKGRRRALGRWTASTLAIFSVILSASCGESRLASLQQARVKTPIHDSDSAAVSRVAGATTQSCGTIDVGATESRTRYRTPLVAAGDRCESEEQTRTCSPGGLSDWTGTFAHPTCEAATTENTCSESNEGEVEVRTVFERGSVAAGESCVAGTQERTCRNGSWSLWDGSDFEYDVCYSEQPVSCGSVLPDHREQRTRFRLSSAPFGQTCESEIQERTCTNGAFSQWTGTFIFDQCSTESSPNCEGVSQGEKQQQTRFRESQVPFGQNCVSEIQERTCLSGAFSSWTGEFRFEQCTVALPLDCSESVRHDQTLSRTRFQSATVPYGGVCASETQVQQCTNGVLGPWSGTFGEPACRVLDPSACGNHAHGAYAVRTRFREYTVPYGGACVSEVQRSQCNDGVLGAWSGTYTATGCTVAVPASCGGIAHGQRAYRTRFERSSVTSPSVCRSETQWQVCDNGVLSAWQGGDGFQFENCSVLPDTSWCDAIPNLGSVRQENGCTLSVDRCNNGSIPLGVRRLTPSGRSGDEARQSCYTAVTHCARRCGGAKIHYAGVTFGTFEN